MENLTDKDLQEFKEIFDLVDTDHSGVISLHELRKLMAALHLRPTEQELEDMFEEAHASPPALPAGTAAGAAGNGGAAGLLSRDGSVITTSSAGSNANNATAASSAGGRTINFNQFATIMARRVQSEYSAEQLRNAFQLFESPDMPEGCISTSVLAEALATCGSQNLSQDEVERLIAAVDPDRTGRINYYDFVDMVTN